jgi:hypothetical protein
MTLEARIPSKTRAGIAALTFAAVVVPFVWATPAKALHINIFDESEDTVQATLDDTLITSETSESIILPEIRVLSGLPRPAVVAGIRFVEPGTDITSDVLRIELSFFGLLFQEVLRIDFTSDGAGFFPDTTGFTVVEETGSLQDVGTEQIPFRDRAGAVVPLPTTIGPSFEQITISVLSDVEIPGPVVGAGLPGLLAACVSVFAWWRRRQKIA